MFSQVTMAIFNGFHWDKIVIEDIESSSIDSIHEWCRPLNQLLYSFCCPRDKLTLFSRSRMSLLDTDQQVRARHWSV